MPDTSYYAGSPIPPNDDNGLTEPQMWNPVTQSWVGGSGTYALRATPATAALVRKLRAGIDGANVTILGDSTGDDQTDWWVQDMTTLAARFPTYRVTHRLWNHANQSYDPLTVIQAGAGVPRNLYATLSNGAYIKTPDTAALSIVGDIDVDVQVACDDWTPGTAFEVCGKSDTAPQAGWFFRLNTDGKLIWFWSADGTATANISSTASVPFSDGAVGWIRVTFDVDNGAAGRTATFYTSTDGATWTPLGTPVSAAGVTSIFDNTASLQFIGRNGGVLLNASSGMAAYRMRVYSGFRQSGGTLVADCDVTDMPTSATPWTGSIGNVWTPTGFGPATTLGEARGTPTLALWNGSAAGQAISYANDGTRFPKLTYQQWMDLAYISFSHNEGTTTLYRTVYKQLADALIAKYPDVGIVACTQNPQTAPRSVGLINAHATRNAAIRTLAASQRYTLVDAYDVFSRSSQGLAALVTPGDGVHPTAAGFTLWAAEADGLFASA